VLLTISVCLGILLTLRLRSPNWPLFLSDQLHGFTALLFFVFLLLHIVTVLVDPFTKFGLGDVLVPFASNYRRAWLGLGVVAFELSLALGLSVHLRRFIGYRAWRVIHYATYAILPLTLVHGLATGTDSRTAWGLGIYVACSLALVTVTAMRLVGSRARVRGPFAAAVALGLLVFASWAVSGPLHSGWAVAAGTPQLVAATPSSEASPAVLALAQPFSDRVSGTIDGRTDTGLKASGKATGNVDLGWTLDAVQAADGSTAGTLTISSADGTPLCVATLQAASSQGFVAGCSPRGAQGSLLFTLRLRQRAGGPLGGLLSVQPGPPVAPATITPAPPASATTPTIWSVGRDLCRRREPRVSSSRKPTTPALVTVATPGRPGAVAVLGRPWPLLELFPGPGVGRGLNSAAPTTCSSSEVGVSWEWRMVLLARCWGSGRDQTALDPLTSSPTEWPTAKV